MTQSGHGPAKLLIRAAINYPRTAAADGFVLGRASRTAVKARPRTKAGQLGAGRSRQKLT